jgi:hypothetical protein
VGGVIRSRRLVREKPGGGHITGLLPTTFPSGGQRDDHFLSWKRDLLPNDANFLVLSGLCWGMLITRCA